MVFYSYADKHADVDLMWISFSAGKSLYIGHSGILPIFSSFSAQSMAFKRNRCHFSGVLFAITTYFK